MTDGLVTLASGHSAAETADRLEEAAKARGLTVFARIDHAAGAAAAGAAAAGMDLRPTILLIFGNARGGTPLMQAARTMGIDLPLKALVWQDEDGTAQVSYNDPAWLARRHGADPGMAQVSALTAVLEALAQAAAR